MVHLKPIPKSLPSAAKLPQTDDYVKERQAAMSRLINVWSSLAERYSKPIEEDDIVDILTGEVVKDRGVVSSWDRTHQGFFTEKHIKSHKAATEIILKEDEVTDEQVPDEKQTEDGEDFDELDSFSTEVGRNVALQEGEVRETGCILDAEDIGGDKILLPSTNFRDDEKEELKEAEKSRKKLYGDDDYSSDEDLEIFRIQLRQFRKAARKKSTISFVGSDGESLLPPSSSPVRNTSPPISLSSSSFRTSSPSVPPPSPSVRTSSSSFRAYSSSVRTSPSCGYASSSVGKFSPPVRASSSSVSASSSSVRTPSSLRTSWAFFRSSPPLSRAPSSSVRLYSPDPPACSPLASSSSVRLSTPPIPPSSSPTWLSSPLPPPTSSPVRSSSPLIPHLFENDSEDELGVWDPPEEQESWQPTKTYEAREKCPKASSFGPKRSSKRKRVILSSDEESPVNSPGRPGRSSPPLTRASSKSLSPKKRIVNGAALLPGSGARTKGMGHAVLGPESRLPRRATSNG